jgi:hypothetical protein
MKFKDWKYAKQCVAFAKEKGIAVPKGLMGVELVKPNATAKNVFSLCDWRASENISENYKFVRFCLNLSELNFQGQDTITIRIDASNPNHIEHDGKVFVRAVRCKECGRMPTIAYGHFSKRNGIFCGCENFTEVWHKHKPTAIKMWNTGNKGE